MADKEQMDDPEILAEMMRIQEILTMLTPSIIALAKMDGLPVILIGSKENTPKQGENAAIVIPTVGGVDPHKVRLMMADITSQLLSGKAQIAQVEIPAPCDCDKCQARRAGAAKPVDAPSDGMPEPMPFIMPGGKRGMH